MEEEKAAKGGEPPEPVVLRMELHCAGCAKKVKKSIKHMPGVVSIVADAAANTVVVAGTADAAALKARIESKTKKSVMIVSSGGGGGGGAKKPAAESKTEKEASSGGGGGGGGGEKKKADKEVAAGAGEKKGDKDAQPTEEKGKKQPHVQKKPNEETVLLKVNLHCDGCADRIRRRIFKIKGVNVVVLDSNAMDEVKVSGTMDVPAMLDYLREKLDRPVEAVAVVPGKKDGGAGGDEKKDNGGDGEKKKAASSGGGGGGGGDGDKKKDKGKSIEMAGPSMVAAAASMAPAPAAASTYHVSPYGHVAYPQAQPPPASYYQYYGGNADAAGYANPNAAGYHQYYGGNADGAGHDNLSPNAAAYYGGAGHANLPHNGAAYYHPDANDAPNHQPYPPYPYHLDLSPAPQMFSDENPNACSLM